MVAGRICMYACAYLREGVAVPGACILSGVIPTKPKNNRLLCIGRVCRSFNQHRRVNSQSTASTLGHAAHLNKGVAVPRACMLSGIIPTNPESDRHSRLAGSVCHGSAATAAPRALPPLLLLESPAACGCSGVGARAPNPGSDSGSPRPASGVRLKTTGSKDSQQVHR